MLRFCSRGLAVPASGRRALSIALLSALLTVTALPVFGIPGVSGNLGSDSEQSSSASPYSFVANDVIGIGGDGGSEVTVLAGQQFEDIFGGRTRVDDTVEGVLYYAFTVEFTELAGGTGEGAFTVLQFWDDADQRIGFGNDFGSNTFGGGGSRGPDGVNFQLLDSQGETVPIGLGAPERIEVTIRLMAGGEDVITVHFRGEENVFVEELSFDRVLARSGFGNVANYTNMEFHFVSFEDRLGLSGFGTGGRADVLEGDDFALIFDGLERVDDTVSGVLKYSFTTTLRQLRSGTGFRAYTGLQLYDDNMERFAVGNYYESENWGGFGLNESSPPVFDLVGPSGGAERIFVDAPEEFTVTIRLVADGDDTIVVNFRGVENVFTANLSFNQIRARSGDGNEADFTDLDFQFVHFEDQPDVGTIAGGFDEVVLDGSDFALVFDGLERVDNTVTGIFRYSFDIEYTELANDTGAGAFTALNLFDGVIERFGVGNRFEGALWGGVASFGEGPFNFDFVDSFNDQVAVSTGFRQPIVVTIQLVAGREDTITVDFRGQENVYVEDLSFDSIVARSGFGNVASFTNMQFEFIPLPDRAGIGGEVGTNEAVLEGADFKTVFNGLERIDDTVTGVFSYSFVAEYSELANTDGSGSFSALQLFDGDEERFGLGHSFDGAVWGGVGSSVPGAFNFDLLGDSEETVPLATGAPEEISVTMKLIAGSPDKVIVSFRGRDTVFEEDIRFDSIRVRSAFGTVANFSDMQFSYREVLPTLIEVVEYDGDIMVIRILRADDDFTHSFYGGPDLSEEWSFLGYMHGLWPTGQLIGVPVGSHDQFFMENRLSTEED